MTVTTDNVPEEALRLVFRESGLSSNGQRVFRYLLFERDRGNGRLTCMDKQIGEALGLCRETVSRRKTELIKKGFIRTRKQTFNHLTGKYQPTVYDLRPGLKLIKAKYGVSHGKSLVDSDSATDRVTVPHGEEGGCLTVESQTELEESTDRVTGEPCDSLSQDTYVSKDQDAAALQGGASGLSESSEVSMTEEERLEASRDGIAQCRAALDESKKKKAEDVG